MKKSIDENQRITLTVGQLRRLVREAASMKSSGDEYDKVVRVIDVYQEMYGKRGVAKALIDAFGYGEVLGAFDEPRPMA